jgi:AAA+ ATPase superfamily predicted ATPase
MQQLFGREPEITLLNTVFTSGRAEFVALYGRRRVGKTYLIRQ